MTSGTNGTATSPIQDVLRYAAGVRAELADLAPAQRDALLEDLEDHLSEVAAELDDPLESRLGPPEAYAAELRASAGLPPAETRHTERVSRLRQLWDTEFRGILRDLQPAWWALRGLLAAFVLAAILGPLPAAVLAIPAVIVSVLLGRRTRGRRGLWVLAIAVNVVAILAAMAVVPTLTASSDEYPIVVQPALGGTLQHEDGRPITNIFPYDAQGQPLSGVRLYDQDGRPITNVSNVTPDGQLIERTYPVEPNGQRVRNAYPQELTIVDKFGQPSGVPAVPPTPPQVTPGAPG